MIRWNKYLFNENQTQQNLNQSTVPEARVDNPVTDIQETNSTDTVHSTSTTEVQGEGVTSSHVQDSTPSEEQMDIVTEESEVKKEEPKTVEPPVLHTEGNGEIQQESESSQQRDDKKSDEDLMTGKSS